MKKLLNKKGFTLMEMLIVVAIIVILVAISIPAFSGALDSARVAADEANFRSAKAAAVLGISLGEVPADGAVYDIAAGAFKTGADATTAADGDMGQCSDHTGAYIMFDADTETVMWTEDGSTDAGECGE